MKGHRPPLRWRSLLLNADSKMITNVYIDGFNLYYGALRGSRYKWLDLVRLASLLFPGDQIGRVCYFTADIRSLSGSGGPRQRQVTYLNVLRTLRGLDIVTGTFRRRVKRGSPVTHLPGSPAVVAISTWEEKKTDVNLATEMIFDGVAGACHRVAVVTNDSDLSRCLQRIRDDLSIEVVVVNPSRSVQTPRELYQSANAVIRLREYHLQQSQLPNQVKDPNGRTIRKPASW